jgi:hypothetical protein
MDERMKTLSIMLRTLQENEAVLLNECAASNFSLTQKELEQQFQNLEQIEMVAVLEKIQQITNSFLISLNHFSQETVSAKRQITDLECWLSISEDQMQTVRLYLQRFFSIF